MITSSNKIPAPLTVSQLTLAIKNALDKNFMQLAVQGEIVNLKLQSSGHCYFNLKDTAAQVSCVIFNRFYSTLQQLPKSGDSVTVHGNLSLYAPRGTYQIIVNKIEFSGSGSLILQLHQLKTKLQSLGWFDIERKRPIPINPKTIGIITSPTGAVIQDILHILSKKLEGFHIIINPVAVQGDTAASQIVKAIGEYNQFQLVDVLILARGGGSLEDLWPFNEECVAKAIYESKIPIISAVGHETDYSISDFVADLRCPTPSMAASTIASSIIEQKARHLVIEQKLDQSISQKIHLLSKLLATLQKHSLFQNPYLLLSLPIQKFDSLMQAMGATITNVIEKKRFGLRICRARLETLSPEHLLQMHRLRLQNYQSQIDKAMVTTLKSQRENIENIKEQLQSVNPKTILKRGYCIPFAENGTSIILESQNLSPFDKLQLLFHDGIVEANITQIKEQSL